MVGLFFLRKTHTICLSAHVGNHYGALKVTCVIETHLRSKCNLKLLNKMSLFTLSVLHLLDSCSCCMPQVKVLFHTHQITRGKRHYYIFQAWFDTKCKLEPLTLARFHQISFSYLLLERRELSHSKKQRSQAVISEAREIGSKSKEIRLTATTAGIRLEDRETLNPSAASQFDLIHIQ